ncbi:MAG: type IX secretion system membrane protein PorP/SprF [Bacteroidetes bacterium]|nr:MAG: type IX secretion system membrane protein PorP/SprF [Bacteroidota bacterium]
MKKLFARLSILCFLLLSFIQQGWAQDPQYSQFYANQLMLNPAFAGAGEGMRIAMNYRAQWVRIPGYYKQMAFSYDMPVFFLGTTQGVGINFTSDVAGEGDLTKLNINLNYAYQLEIIDDNFLRFGLSAGIQQASIDFYKLRFPDQIDPRGGFVRPTNEPFGTFSQAVIRPDVGAGIAYFNEFAWVGVTVNHITQPLETFSDFGGAEARLPRKYTVTGGINIPLRSMNSRREVSLTPVFLYKMQGEFMQIDGGLYINADPMVFGVWYRHQDAVIGLIGIKQGPFSFGYSYDYTVSDLTQGISGGSHEVSLVLDFPYYQRPRGMRHRRMPCPKF